MSNSPIDRIPLLITGYHCVVCKKWHRKPSLKFSQHYAANAKHRGWKEQPPEK